LIIIENIIAFVANVLGDSSYLVCIDFVIKIAETDFFLVDGSFVVGRGHKFIF
jgi:hypothetical protein